jgi:hypothetical protein
MPTLNVRLDDELDGQLTQEAELADESRSKLARRAIEEFLSRRRRQRFLDAIARRRRPLLAAPARRVLQYSTIGLPGEPVAPIILSGAQTNAPS